MNPDNTAGLEDSIKQYEEQLSQVQAALNASSGTDTESLLSLRSNIQELITLTKENLQSVKQQVPSNTTAERSDNINLDDEYALFKAEIEAVDQKVQGQCSSSVEDVDIQDDLEALDGMKCQAPHGHQWGQSSYHNALICEVIQADNLTCMQEIQVKVIFINPTHREMLPCPYYLDGNCRFSDTKCHYSHGELVPLSVLREYKDPDFTVVKVGVRVLAKYTDSLWHRAKVLSRSDFKCDVKFESSGVITEVKLQDVLPLHSDSENEVSESSDSESSNISDSEKEVISTVLDSDALLKMSSSALGGWEKHTKGFGSKLMAKMGYITGMGLGIKGEGRIDPVEAVVLPAGKSLDHCMELKEQTGDKDLFKAEKKLRRIQRRQEAKLKMQYERAKRDGSLFDFLNVTLGSKESSQNELAKGGATSSNESGASKTVTSQQLNVHSLQVGEDIRRAEKDLVKLREALHRHRDNHVTQGKIKDKIDFKKREIESLKDSEKRIAEQQRSHQDRRKLSVF